MPVEGYKLDAVVMPEALLRNIVRDVARFPKNAYEVDLAIQRKKDIAKGIIDFTQAAIQICRDGGKVLLTRDFVPPDMMQWVADNGNYFSLSDINNTLMNLRLDLAAQLLMNGAEPMVEEGILRDADFYQGTQRRVRDEVKWAKLKCSTNAAKLNLVNPSPVMQGPRPNHRFLHQETVYALEDKSLQLQSNYGLGKTWKSGDLYITTAEYAGGKKTLFEALYLDRSQNGLEKFMMDILNTMEAIHFLHGLKMIHRDVKSSNIFEGGFGFDNITVIKADKIIYEPNILGTPGFMPEGYDVVWPKCTPYFSDIFAFAISIAEAISLTSVPVGPNVLEDFAKNYERGQYLEMSPGHFVGRLKSRFFPLVKNEKSLKAAEVVEKMIMGMGEYTLADAQRDLGAVFGATL